MGSVFQSPFGEQWEQKYAPQTSKETDCDAFRWWRVLFNVYSLRILKSSDHAPVLLLLSRWKVLFSPSNWIYHARICHKFRVPRNNIKTLLSVLLMSEKIWRNVRSTIFYPGLRPHDNNRKVMTYFKNIAGRAWDFYETTWIWPPFKLS